jgi:hypothetical protein
MEPDDLLCSRNAQLEKNALKMWGRESFGDTRNLHFFNMTAGKMSLINGNGVSCPQRYHES